MKFLIAVISFVVQISGADRVEAIFKNAGEHTYVFVQNRQKIGTLLMKTRIEKEEGRKVAVFDDQMVIELEGKKMTVSMKETAALGHLGVLSSMRHNNDGDWSIRVDGTKATMKVEGREQTFEITETVVGEQGLLRLVCVAEQKVQASFKVDVLSMTGERLEKEHQFRCVGKERIEIGGRMIDSFKWEEKWEWKGTLKGVPTASRIENSYWVSPDGYLLRFMGPTGVEILLEMK